MCPALTTIRARVCAARPVRYSAKRLLVRPRVMVRKIHRLHVRHRRMMHDDQDELHPRIDDRQLTLQPAALLAVRQQRGVAVERHRENLAAHRHRIPAAAAQFRKRTPPALEAFRFGACREFMVAERRVDPQLLLAPGPAFFPVHRIVGAHAVPRQIAVDEQRSGLLARDFVDQCPAYARIGRGGFRGIREAHVAVGDEHQRIGQVRIVHAERGGDRRVGRRLDRQGCLGEMPAAGEHRGANDHGEDGTHRSMLTTSRADV